MATQISGINCDVSFDGTALENVLSWSVDISIDEAAAAHSDSSGWKERTTGAKDWTGEFVVQADSGKTTSALWTAFGAGTTGAFVGTADTAVTYTGNIKLLGITGVMADPNTGEAIAHTWAFGGHGALTPTTT